MKETVNPKLSNKEKSLVELYKQQEKKEAQYCYRPYRNLRNYLT